MRFITVAKILGVILAISFFAMFIVQNYTPASIIFPFAGPHRFGLIYLLLISFSLGGITAFVIIMTIQSKLEKKRRAEETEDLFDED